VSHNTRSLFNSYHAVYEVLEEFSDSDDGNDKGSRLWAEGGTLVITGEDLEGCGGINYTKKMNPVNWVYQTQDTKALDDVTSNSDYLEEDDPFMEDDNHLPGGQG
jgi:hypothetical protein